MTRFFKIFGITLASIVGVVLVAAAVAVWVVFTPERLTPVAKQFADKYVTCEHELGDVDLTFFSTFPEFGLRADGICLINPMEGAQSDTLLVAPKVVATVDVKEFLNNKNLKIREVSLEDVVANIYINEEGENNISVFLTSPDTTDEDTAAFSLPFNEIEVKNLSLTSPKLTFVDKKDSVTATLLQTDLSAKIGSWDDVLLNLVSQSASAQVKGTQYADSLQLALHLPAAVNLDSMHFDLHKATLGINEFEIKVDGAVDLKDAFKTTANVQTNTWEIEPLMALLPEPVQKPLQKLRLKGNLQLDADAQMDMATEQSHVTVNKLKADVWNSKLTASGEVDDLLGNMFLDLQLEDVDVRLQDIAFMLPKNMKINSRVRGNAAAAIHLQDLTDMKLEKGKISGDFQLDDVDFQMDSMTAYLKKPTLAFTIPNANPSHKKVDWAEAQIHFGDLRYEQKGTLQAHLGKGDLNLESGNVLSNDPILYAAADLQSKEELTAHMDSMDAKVEAPDLVAYAEYDTKNKDAIPLLEADLKFDDLSGNYTDIVGHLAQSQLTASITGSRRDKTAPKLTAQIKTKALDAKVGEDMKVKTEAVSMEAAARYNSKGENMLLKWNPRLKVNLHQGEADLTSFEKLIEVPQMTFAYSNKVFTIDTSKIVLGNSDFSLSGEVRNIGKWMRHQADLEGELNFTSSHTDANELLALFSANEGSEEQSDETTEAAANTADTISQSNPFLVPTDVNLVLNTHIKETEIFNQTAKNLAGRIYVQDGQLVLEEVGFVCRAAQLQLTAMYRTPRRNHIYLGFDYHMLDVNIEELISMIPDLGTMVPMLSSFKGAAELHLAAETYLTSEYKPKISTLRGACSIFGKDLVVLDSETFTKISKLLMFNKKTENVVDSISAEITIYKDEIDVYPFCVSIDNYMAALGGRHNLDMSFDYHVNLLSPLYLGVDVSGTFDDLDIKLAPCRYAKDFKPLFHGKVNTQSAELRQVIRDSMRKNVHIQSDSENN